MKTVFTIVAVLFSLSTMVSAQSLTIGDCESIEMECMGSSLWCDGGEVIKD